MSKTTWCNIYKDKYDVYCGRAGKGKDGYFGNPIRNTTGIPGATLKDYSKYFYNRLKTDKEFKDRILKLKGLKLGCFCKNQDTCHVGIIIKYLENG